MLVPQAGLEPASARLMKPSPIQLGDCGIERPELTGLRHEWGKHRMAPVLVPPLGLEPRPNGLKGRYSTIELQRHKLFPRLL